MKNLMNWTLITSMLICLTVGHPLLAEAQFDKAMARQLESEIAVLMGRAQVPGTSVAIVQDGQIVYAHGFGVREKGKPDRVTPETLMMIGSTGKSMTTMMMAALIDQGKIAWDTPAKEIYPDFAVSDPALTPTLTLRNMVCNCTGIQRHDLEMQFASRPTTPEGVIRSLRDLGFTGAFGKTFGYVNQMVASGSHSSARRQTQTTLRPTDEPARVTTFRSLWRWRESWSPLRRRVLPGRMPVTPRNI